jgi:hypothetical protein
VRFSRKAQVKEPAVREPIKAAQGRGVADHLSVVYNQRKMPTLPGYPWAEDCPNCRIDWPDLKMSWGMLTRHQGGWTRDLRVYRCARCGGVVLCGIDATTHQLVMEYAAGESANDPANPARGVGYLLQALAYASHPLASMDAAANGLDAMLIAKGYKQGSLGERLEQAVKDNVLPERIGKLAHQIGLDTHDQRHTDEHAPLPTQQHAMRFTEFVVGLLSFLSH